MPVETRYYRSDTATVNGLTANNLYTSQSGVGGYKQVVMGDPEWLAERCYLGIRVWKRSMDGVETEITAGKPVALVYRESAGIGILSASWNCPQTTLQPTDSIVVRVYTSLWSAAGGFWAWNLMGTWQTEQLGAGILNAAAWTVYYYFWLSITYAPPGYPLWTARFYYDTATYNSRIENFTWTLPVPPVAKRIIGDGLVWIVC